jgi:hypothetical protein
VVEIVAFTGPLTHACKDGEAAVLLGDVVDQLENDDGLADACTTEGADFTALGEGTDQIDNLDAGLEDRRAGVLIDQRRCGTMIG